MEMIGYDVGDISMLLNARKNESPNLLATGSNSQATPSRGGAGNGLISFWPLHKSSL
jgi:hypothetical protein